MRRFPRCRTNGGPGQPSRKAVPDPRTPRAPSGLEGQPEASHTRVTPTPSTHEGGLPRSRGPKGRRAAGPGGASKPPPAGRTPPGRAVGARLGDDPAPEGRRHRGGVAAPPSRVRIHRVRHGVRDTLSRHAVRSRGQDLEGTPGGPLTSSCVGPRRQRSPCLAFPRTRVAVPIGPSPPRLDPSPRSPRPSGPEGPKEGGAWGPERGSAGSSLGPTGGAFPREEGEARPRGRGLTVRAWAPESPVLSTLSHPVDVTPGVVPAAPHPRPAVRRGGRDGLGDAARAKEARRGPHAPRKGRADPRRGLPRPNSRGPAPPPPTDLAARRRLWGPGTGARGGRTRSSPPRRARVGERTGALREGSFLKGSLPGPEGAASSRRARRRPGSASVGGRPGGGHGRTGAPRGGEPPRHAPVREATGVQALERGRGPLEAPTPARTPRGRRRSARHPSIVPLAEAPLGANRAVPWGAPAPLP
jgi:hypothetical protein